MAIRVFDCWYHDQDIREALDRPGFLEGDVADLALGRIPTKALPYVVGKKASAPQGTTVVFDVTGEPPIEAAVGVDGRAALLAGRTGGTDDPPHARPAHVRPARRRALDRGDGPRRGSRADRG